MESFADKGAVLNIPSFGAVTARSFKTLLPFAWLNDRVSRNRIISYDFGLIRGSLHSTKNHDVCLLQIVDAFFAVAEKHVNSEVRNFWHSLVLVSTIYCSRRLAGTWRAPADRNSCVSVSVSVSTRVACVCLRLMSEHALHLFLRSFELKKTFVRLGSMKTFGHHQCLLVRILYEPLLI